MQIRSAQRGDLEAVVRLLDANHLPTADCAEQIGGFIVAEEHASLIAVAGLEQHDEVGLLRSLAVVPDRRGSGIARTLCADIEQRAAQAGVTRLFLLTEDAAPYFLRLGYSRMERDKVPAQIRATRQFSDLCPCSAQVLFRNLDATAAEPAR